MTIIIECLKNGNSYAESYAGQHVIPLDPAYFNNLKNMAKKEAAEAQGGWSMSYNTIASTFSCLFEESFTIQEWRCYTNRPPRTHPYRKTGQKKYGTLYALSLPEVAGWLHSYGKRAFHPVIILAGYLAKALHWQREDVGNDDEMYNDTIIMEVEMKKDWNLLKYEIAEIFTSKTGKTYPAITRVSRLAGLPANVKWIAMGY